MSHGTMSAVLLAALLAGPAAAQEGQEAVPLSLERELAVAAPPAEVWSRIGDPCDIADWLPSVESCEVTQADGVTERVMNGGAVVERFTDIDDAGFRHDYVMTAGPLAAMDYRGTLWVEPGADGGSVVHWRDRVTVPPAQEAAMRAAVGGLLDAGMAGIEDLLAAE